MVDRTHGPPGPSRLNTEQGNLDRAFAGGLAWTAGAKWVTQFVTWLSVIVSARILTPQDFGAVELASFATLVTNVLAEFGIGTAVLQMRELDRRALAQLNSVSLIFSTLAFALSSALTPFIAAFFNTRQLMLLMLINNLQYFITGFQAVPMGLLERDLDYRKISIAESAQGIVQAVVTVACALAGLGYWSLLAGGLVGRVTIAGAVVFWRPIPFAVPRRDEIVSPMRFGFQVAVARLAWASYGQADTIMIGRVLGTSALGVYRLAISIATAPADKIVFLIMRVTGPLFSKVQENKALMKRYFLFISDALALVTFPLIFGLIAVAPEVVETALGPQWKGAIGPLKWLAAYTALRPLSTLANQILISLHLASFNMWLTMFAAVVMPIAFYLAAPYGTAMVALMWLAMSPLVMGPLVVKLFREIHCSMGEYLRVMSPPALGSLGMVLAVISVKRWLIPASMPVAWSLVCQIAVGGVSYLAIVLIFFRGVVMRYVRFALKLRSGVMNEAVADMT